MDKDAHQVINDLRKFNAQMTELLNLLADKRSFSRDELSHVRSLFVALKDDLKSECRLSDTVHGRANRTRLQTICYDPAIRNASANLHVGTSTNPITSNWHSVIYGARIDITHMLFDLEENHPDVP
jgi:hypothetical protein